MSALEIGSERDGRRLQMSTDVAEFIFSCRQKAYTSIDNDGRLQKILDRESEMKIVSRMAKDKPNLWLSRLHKRGPQWLLLACYTKPDIVAYSNITNTIYESTTSPLNIY
jgi:hypothetical protein